MQYDFQSKAPLCRATTWTGGAGQLQLQANSEVGAVSNWTGSNTATCGVGVHHQLHVATNNAATERPVLVKDILEQKELR